MENLAFEQRFNEFVKKFDEQGKTILNLQAQLKKQDNTIRVLMQPKQMTPKQQALAEQIKKEQELAKTLDPKDFLKRFIKKGSLKTQNHIIKEDGSVEIEEAVATLTATHYYLYPWATVGDVTAIPNTVETSVNYPQGWTGPYSLPYPSNPDALAVTRTAWNQAMLDATLNIQQYQQWGTPNFISTSDNGGSPFPYSLYAATLYDDGVNGPRVFRSMANTNTTLPSNAGTLSSTWFLDDFSSQNISVPAVTFAGGVANGDVVYFTGTNYAKALANGTGSQNAAGIADVSNSRVISFGSCDLLTGLSPGAEYFLSTVTSGALTAVQPSFNAVSIGTGYTTTELLINIESIPTDAWTPMFINSANISPGTSPGTQFNVSTGGMRDLSNTANCSLNVPITNATIASNTATGGAVPAALFPISTINSGVFLGIFLAFKADGTSAYAAVDNQVNGSTILADPTLVAAGYVYVRRIGMTYCPSNGTIRPISTLDGKTYYVDDISSYVVTGTTSTSPQTFAMPVPQTAGSSLINANIYMYIDLAVANTDCTTSIYPVSASSPGTSIAGFASNYEIRNGSAWESAPTNQADMLLDSAGKVNIISTRSGYALYLNCPYFIDNRLF